MSKITLSKAQELYALSQNVTMPTKSDIDLCRIAATSCKTVKEFSDFLNIEPIIFKTWCNKSPEFNRAFNAWRTYATSDIEAALAKRATGFTKTTRKDVLDKAGYVHTLETQTYFPPDPTAAQFWLKNRAPQDWKDASQVDVNVTANIRAWLVDAARTSQGDGEMLNITPERQDSVLIEQMTEAETVQPLSLNDAPLEQPLSLNSDELEVIEAEPVIATPVEPPDTIPVSAADPLARLNGSWIRSDKS